MTRRKLPAWLVVDMCRVMLGEIYPAIRAIALRLKEDERHLLIRYYLDREPTEYDEESLDIMATELSAGMGPDDKVDCIDIDLVKYTGPLRDMDRLDGLVYRRRERDMHEICS
jgi:hypothetical protein